MVNIKRVPDLLNQNPYQLRIHIFYSHRPNKQDRTLKDIPLQRYTENVDRWTKIF